ncbi:uncharacterized protein LOC142548647 [Primulina tabacum]|uniref:uncharacterized protein LOC142548647 n=1 Tax=Primulina tabacum TaxID=48773 RepID=UPI003F5A7B4B
MASSLHLQWHPLLPTKTRKTLFIRNPDKHFVVIHHVASIRAFRRSDLDGFAKRVASGEALRDVWRGANDGFELLVFETKKTAERIDRRYAVSRRLSAVAQAASDKALELDRELEITQRWRGFSLNFRTNWPRYRRQLNDLLDTPLGRGFATLFFVWFALSGWLFRVLIFATWVLPFAGPLLIGAMANNLVIKGACPACRKQFVGYKSQTIQCASCGNIVWQPQGGSSKRGGRGTTSSSKSQPDIIDVEFEEK